MRYHSFLRTPEHPRGAVLLLHGILGAPQYFDFLLPDIPADYEVSGVLYQGHGGTPTDFAAGSVPLWRGQAEQALDALPAGVPVLIAAHSMGTLFSLELAAKRPERIAGMLLLNVPLAARLTPYCAGCSVLLACGYQPQLPRSVAMRRAYSIAPDANFLHYLPWLKRYLELFDEMQAVQAILPQMHTPAEVFQAVHDELVSPKTLPMLAENPALHLHILRDSTHFYYPDADRARILRAWRSIIRKSEGTHPLDHKP